ATAEGVRSGMSIQAEIVLEEKANVLVVPIEAVREIRGKHYVQLANGENTDSSSADGEAARDGFAERVEVVERDGLAESGREVASGREPERDGEAGMPEMPSAEEGLSGYEESRMN